MQDNVSYSICSLYFQKILNDWFHSITLCTYVLSVFLDMLPTTEIFNNLRHFKDKCLTCTNAGCILVVADNSLQWKWDGAGCMTKIYINQMRFHWIWRQCDMAAKLQSSLACFQRLQGDWFTRVGYNCNVLVTASAQVIHDRSCAGLWSWPIVLARNGMETIFKRHKLALWQLGRF